MAKQLTEAKTLVPGIALALRELIWKGQLKPGQHINQADWAENLGVSLIPLREAMRMLEGEGMVEVLPNRGVRVMPVTSAELEEWYLEFKGLLYAILPLAVPLVTEASMERLRTLSRQLDEVNAPSELHLDFWNLLFEPCGMPRLLNLLQSLIWRLGRYFQGGGKAMMTEYREIHPNREEFLDACQAGDVAEALRTVLEFVTVRKEVFAKRLLADGKA